jgi:hypothetical protein
VVRRRSSGEARRWRPDSGDVTTEEVGLRLGKVEWVEWNSFRRLAWPEDGRRWASTWRRAPARQWWRSARLCEEEEEGGALRASSLLKG